jgi:predicted amidohydrolase
MENQVYVFSVNRAGDIHGSSMICPPWIGYKVKPVVLEKEETVHIETVEKKVLDSVREGYKLSADRLEKY